MYHYYTSISNSYGEVYLIWVSSQRGQSGTGLPRPEAWTEVINEKKLQDTGPT